MGAYIQSQGGHTHILSILVNDGHGAFTSLRGPPIDVGWPAFEIVALDVNADKNIDLVATTVDSKALCIKGCGSLGRRAWRIYTGSRLTVPCRGGSLSSRGGRCERRRQTRHCRIQLWEQRRNSAAGAMNSCCRGPARRPHAGS